MAFSDGMITSTSLTPSTLGGRLLQWTNDQIERTTNTLIDRFTRASKISDISGGAIAGNKADEFIRQAMRFMGQPYRWGGGHGATLRGPGPVDCSGLVTQAARFAGINLDGTAATQQKKGTRIPMNALKPGDLVFHGHPASHVGIYIGNGKVLHAPHTGAYVSITGLSYFDNAVRVFDAPGNLVPENPDQAAAPTEPNPASAPAGPGGTIVVKPGDTLWKLAQRHLGSGTRWHDIFALNRDIISDPNVIRVGQTLRLPGQPAPAPVAPAVATPVQPSPAPVYVAPAPAPAVPSPVAVVAPPPAPMAPLTPPPSAPPVPPPPPPMPPAPIAPPPPPPMPQGLPGFLQSPTPEGSGEQITALQRQLSDLQSQIQALINAPRT